MGERDLSPETVGDYFTAGVEAAFTLSASTNSILEIDPVHQELRLISPALGGEPDLAAYEHISVERISLIGKQGDWFRLTVDAAYMHYEAYVLLVSIVDQLESGASFRHAVSESLAALKGLLSSRRRMSDEKEAGLLGELLVLRHAIDRLGEDQAMQAWLGPYAEEHDFGFEDFDVEVKTTRSESRTHVIGTESQLQPAPGRPLFLLSVQVTLAGASEDGFSLPEIIASVRERIDRVRRIFDAALQGLGWAEEAADLYKTRVQIRSAPRAYLVNSQFPAITASRLDQVVPQRTLVSAVSYRVDVSHLNFMVPPAPLEDFCEEPV